MEKHNFDFLRITEENSEGFKQIADILFNQFAINSNRCLYRILEMEFYWHTDTHQDRSVYSRKHVDPENATWFFHYSGVDIALKNDNGGYGGILIRKVIDLDSKKIYNGPMVCAMRLFSGLSVFEKSEMAILVRHKFQSSEITISQRIGLGKNAKINEMNTNLIASQLNHQNKAIGILT